MSDDYEELCRYKLAADSGDAVAHCHLGFFYAKGRGGLPQDDRKAARTSSSPPTKDSRRRNTISGSCTSKVAAACRKMIVRPRAYTNSPPNRDAPLRSAISGSSTRADAAGCRTTIDKPRTSMS